MPPKKGVLTDRGEVPPRGPQRHWMEVDDERVRAYCVARRHQGGLYKERQRVCA